MAAGLLLRKRFCQVLSRKGLAATAFKSECRRWEALAAAAAALFLVSRSTPKRRSHRGFSQHRGKHLPLSAQGTGSDEFVPLRFKKVSRLVRIGWHIFPLGMEPRLCRHARERNERPRDRPPLNQPRAPADRFDNSLSSLRSDVKENRNSIDKISVLLDDLRKSPTRVYVWANVIALLSALIAACNFCWGCVQTRSIDKDIGRLQASLRLVTAVTAPQLLQEFDRLMESAISQPSDQPLTNILQTPTLF